MTITSYSVVLDIIKQIRQVKIQDFEPSTSWQREVGLPLEKYPNFNDFRIPGSKEIDWDSHQTHVEALYAEEVDHILNKFKGKDIYAVSFSDNSGDWECEVEHGPVLERPNVIRYNNH